MGGIYIIRRNIVMKRIIKILIVILILLAGWHFMPMEWHERIMETFHTSSRLITDKAAEEWNSRVQEVKRDVYSVVSDEDHDIANEEIVARDSLARDLSRIQKEDVNIDLEVEKETWYITWDEWKDFYQTASEYVKALFGEDN